MIKNIQKSAKDLQLKDIIPLINQVFALRSIF